MKIYFQSDWSLSASLQIELQSDSIDWFSMIFIDFHQFSLVTTQSTNVNRQPCQPSTGNRQPIIDINRKSNVKLNHAYIVVVAAAVVVVVVVVVVVRSKE